MTTINEAVTRGSVPGKWWRPLNDGRIECDLCPRNCRLNVGDRGFCFVRANRDGQMILETYGRSTGFCIDPIEKKPLNHFLPGTPVLSFGTAGCNLGCKFCQNWDISKSREVSRLSDIAGPDEIAAAALESGCRSVAFTYNDPVIWAEYAIDVARACRKVGIKTVAVTAGYITAAARGPFFAEMDAANVDLKAFTEQFYYKITASHLQPVLDTLRYLRHETDVWFEITNLVIPGLNDDQDEFRRMTEWCVDNLGVDVPIHFSAFHPDWRMRDRPTTPLETLLRAYDTARDAGLRYVFVGNVHQSERQTTYCPGCSQAVIVRDWYEITAYHMQGSRCRYCQTEIAGRFESQAGNWGRRRQPIRIRSENNITTHSIQTTKSKRNDMDATKNVNRPIAPAAMRQLVEFASAEVLRAVLGSTSLPVKTLDPKLANEPCCGVFVTLKRNGTLRGCCGSLGGGQNLAQMLTVAAHRTALQDSRFPPVSPGELPHLSLDITVLSSPMKVAGPPEDRVHQIKVGTHGLRIASRDKSGLLLPSVPEEQGWNEEQFLVGLCRKAGLPESAWRSDETVLESFTGQAAGRTLSDFSELVQNHSPARRFTDAETEGLLQWCEQNLKAAVSGATPAYYAMNLPDGDIGGMVLEIDDESRLGSMPLMKLAPRGGMPLQATLFEFCQIAGNWLRDRNSKMWKSRLMLLDQTMPLGLLSDANFPTIYPQLHAVVISDGQQSAVAFDRKQSTSKGLIDVCRGKMRGVSPRCQLFGWSAYSTTERIAFGTAVLPATGPDIRPPAVAGKFYPAEDQARNELVDDLLKGLNEIPRVTAKAAMTPHAGLKFSGKLSADVWRRLDLPETVIVIGPKHTPLGVNWAVAPHQIWKLSEQCSVQSDPGLARRIAAEVSGMELDAAAHAGEHGVEVQLPILAKLAPGIRVVGIAMGSATMEQLEQAAADLAKLIRSLPKPPLLVVSSDMNHFADDPETHRRDALALKQLEMADPRGLLSICQSEQISMCGQIPAALVLMTLQQLASPSAESTSEAKTTDSNKMKYDLIGYATSSEVSADHSRVVGYASVIWS